MTRPIWKRVVFGEVLWKDKTTKAKVAEVAGYVFAVLLLGTPYPYAFAIVLFAVRYRKLLKARQ